MDQNADLWKHCLDYAALSDIGLRRTDNQDSLAVTMAGSQEAWQRRGHLFVVADGMGAHAAGELASQMAVEAISRRYEEMSRVSPPDALLRAVSDANRQIHDRGETSEDSRGMGTTASTLVLLPQGAIIAHVGDSRVYRLRGQRFEQLTFDHSLVWEISAAGNMPESDVPEYVPRNIITRSLGPNPEVAIDLEGPFPIEAGDMFLLCSDGLSGVVRDEEIGTILGCMSPEDAVRSLVDLANLRGGPDNITAMVVRVTGPQIARPADGSADAESRLPARPVQRLLWALLALFVVATIASMGLRVWAAASVSLIVAACVGLAILVRRYAGESPRCDFGGTPFGKGPYRSFACAPTGEFVERLSRIVQQLHDEATHNDWPVDWHYLNEIRAEADEAAFASRHPRAVRGYCHAISFMMAQLPERRS